MLSRVVVLCTLLASVSLEVFPTSATHPPNVCLAYFREISAKVKQAFLMPIDTTT